MNRISSKRQVHFLVVGDETVASTRCRVLAHLQALESAGYSTSVTFQEARPAKRLLRLPLRMRDELRDLGRADEADILFVHRRCYPPILAWKLRRQGRATVFDIDDAIYLPSPTEPHSGTALRRYRRNFEATAASAHLVICGNPELADKVPHKRTVIIPTAVDCERFHPGAHPPAEIPAAGWVGHSSNFGYLEAIAPSLKDVSWHHPQFKLIVVADRPPRLEGVPMEFRRWSLETEVDSFRDMAIGLMPLDDTPWTRAKCAYKLLQYMALGVPSVVSPVGMSRDVVETGQNAFLAKTVEDWTRQIDALLRSPELRQRIGAAGRETVEKEFARPLVGRRLVACLDRVVTGTTRPTLA